MVPVDDMARGGEFHQTANGQESRLSATEKYLQHIQDSVSDRNAVVHKTVDEFNTTKREVEHEARWNLVKAFFGSLSPAGERFGTSVGAAQAEKESKLRAAREQFKTSMSVPLSESRGYAEGGRDIRKYVKEGGGSLSVPWGSSGAGAGGGSRFVSSASGGRTATDIFKTSGSHKRSSIGNDFQDKLKPVDSGKTSSGGEHTTQPLGNGQAQNGNQGLAPSQVQQNGYGDTGQQTRGQYGSPYAQGAYPSSRAGGVSSHGRSGQSMTDDELRALLASSKAPLSDTFTSTGFAPSSGGGYGGGGLSGMNTSASSAGGGGLGAYGRAATPTSSAMSNGGKISLPTTPRQGVGRTPFMPPMGGGGGGGASKNTGNKPTVADRELIEELSQEAGLQTTNSAEEPEQNSQ